MVGGTQTSFRRVHAEQGHVFVVAASHLIFLFRQPLQARITKRLVRICWLVMDAFHTLQPLMAVMLINEYIVLKAMNG